METVQLTPAELELIKLNREKEEAAKKEAELTKQVQREKEIQSKKEEIANDKVKFERKLCAITNLHNELGSGYELITQLDTVQYSLSEWGDSERKEYFSQSQSYDSAYIVHSASKMEIHPYFERVKQKGSSYRYTTEMRYRITNIPSGVLSYGYRSERTDRLSSAKTIKEKINAFHSRNVRNIEMKNLFMNGLQWLLEEVKSLNPTAKEVKSFNNSDRYSDKHNCARVIFESGLELCYSWSKTEEGFKSNMYQVVTSNLSKENQQTIQSYIISNFAK